MSHPVTRAEVREELANHPTKAELAKQLEKFATKEDLYATFATKKDLEIWGGALMDRMVVEIERAVRGAMASVQTGINAVDDQYRDLPGRVARLEAKVFAPERRRR